MTDEEIDQVLIDAERVLDVCGWCKGTLQNNAGHVCAQGALNIALTGDAYMLARNEELIFKRNTVRDKVRRMLGVISIAFWNDDVVTTKEDVQLAFRRARGCSD